jgi:hypothetical protein
LLAASSGALRAAPVTYDINFALTSGSGLPTSGEFTYDSTLMTFDSFNVVWDGLTFNMLTAANNGPGFTTCGLAQNAAGTFALLTGGSTCAIQQEWEGEGSPTLVSFWFFTSTPSVSQNLILTSLPADMSGGAQGTFTITAVPEPRSNVMVAIGLAALAAMTSVARRRKKNIAAAPGPSNREHL